MLNNCFDRNSEPQLKFTTLDFLIEENEISDFEKKSTARSKSSAQAVA